MNISGRGAADVENDLWHRFRVKQMPVSVLFGNVLLRILFNWNNLSTARRRRLTPKCDWTNEEKNAIKLSNNFDRAFHWFHSFTRRQFDWLPGKTKSSLDVQHSLLVLHIFISIYDSLSWNEERNLLKNICQAHLFPCVVYVDKSRTMTPACNVQR